MAVPKYLSDYLGGIPTGVYQRLRDIGCGAFAEAVKIDGRQLGALYEFVIGAA